MVCRPPIWSGRSVRRMPTRSEAAPPTSHALPLGTFGSMSIGMADGALVIEAPGALDRAWPVTAALFGVPWLAAVVVGTIWYLGWGVPDGTVARILIWIVMMAFTVALHALALLSVWSTVYGRTGRETLTIGPERIEIVRRAGRVPIKLHIRRTIVERAELLPERPGRKPHPRVEVKAWRSAVRFGAALDAQQAQVAVTAINTLFERDEAARHALTGAGRGDTIARTRSEGREHDPAMKGTSRTGTGLRKRAGTVEARGARRSRKSPPSFGPNGRAAK